MPADDARQTAGQRLAADLRSKREEHGLSDDDLREKMRVPGGLVQAFESGQLLGHPMFNRVYLRSLVRSYADAAGVPSAAALSALASTLEGNYEEGQLEREIEAYEREGKAESKRGEDAAVEEEPEAPEATAAAGEEREAEAEEQSQEPDWTTQSPPSASLEEARRREREKEERAQARRREREERARQQEQRRRQREEQQQQRREQRQQQKRPEREPEQQEQRQREGDRPARRRRRDRRRSGSSNVGRWIVGAVLLAAVAAGVFFLVQSPGGGDAETAQSAAATSDTAAGGAEQPAQQDRPPPANLQLGEMMNFTVVADGGPVRDLKVTRDQDVRRPYWIEAGQAIVFPTSERIIIENPSQDESVLQNIRLLAEGHPYPTSRRDSLGRIVITRQDMQTFADTVRGEPAQIPTQRDTAAFTG
jgi:cytoskeletal protein RodZ